MPRSFIPLAIVMALACTLFGVLGGLAAHAVPGSGSGAGSPAPRCTGTPSFTGNYFPPQP